MIKKITLLFLLMLCSCIYSSTYEYEYDKAVEFFRIKPDIPDLIWVDEEVYAEMRKYRAWLTDTTLGWYSPRYVQSEEVGKMEYVVFIREKYKHSELLRKIEKHELGHIFFELLPKKVQSEYFAYMYSKMRN